MPDELVFAREPERPVAGSGGDDDGFAEVLRPLGEDGLDLAVVLDGGDLVELQFRAVVDRLVDELFAELAAGKREESGVVLDLGEYTICPPKDSRSRIRTDRPARRA